MGEGNGETYFELLNVLSFSAIVCSFDLGDKFDMYNLLNLFLSVNV